MMTREELHKNIAYQAEMKPEWAIAYALLELAKAIQQALRALRP
jgi:hypothetical protein